MTRQKGAYHNFKEPKERKPQGKGIACVYCHVEGQNIVLETRKQDGWIKRLRKCVKCGRTFKTSEIIKES